MSMTVDAALKAARLAMKAGDPLAASRVLLPELRRFPSNARLLVSLAEVQSTRTGLPAKPFSQAHLQRLLAIRAQSGLAAATEEAHVALLLDPHSPLANGILGSFLLELGQPDAAIDPLRLAFKRDAKSPQIGTNLSIALRLAGISAEAADVAKMVLRHHPNLMPAKASLAMALVEDGMPLEAVKILRDMVASSPKVADIHFELGRALFAAQEFDAARTAFEIAVEIDPNHDRALNELGSAVLTAGNFDRARTIFETAIKAHPNSAAGYYNLARSIDVAAGDPLISQMQELEKKTTRQTDQILLNFGLAKAFEDAGEVEESFLALKNPMTSAVRSIPMIAIKRAISSRP